MHLFRGALIAAAVGATLVNGYSFGPNSCSMTPRGDHGTPNSNSAATLVFEDALGNPITEYTPGTQYTYRVTPPASYKGFVIAIVKGAVSQTVPNSGNCAGVMGSVSNGQMLSCGGCAYSGHNSGAVKSSTSGVWTAPSAGTGTVSLQFMWTNGAGSNTAASYAVAFPEAAPSPGPTPQSTPASTTTPTSTPTWTPTPSGTASATVSVEPTPSSSLSPGASPLSTTTPTPTTSNTPSMTPTPSWTPTWTPTPSWSPTWTPTPSASPSQAPCNSACSGHGSCRLTIDAGGSVNGTACDCLSTWAGDGFCSSCTPGWTLTDGACALAPTAASVVTLFFTGDVDAVAGAPGSDARTTFVNALEAAVEATLGLTPSGRALQSASGRVRVTGLDPTPSGFDADVTILPGSAGQPNVTALASTLVTAARDSTSSLYSAPVVGAALDASTNAASASSTVTPTPAGRVVPSGAGCAAFAFSADLTSGLTLEWSIATSQGVCLDAGADVPDGAALVGRLTHNAAGTWLAMGFNDAFAMAGTDAILGLPASSEVRDTHLTGRGASAVVTDASNDLSDVGITSSGDSTIMTFTRPLDTGDSDDMDISAAVQGGESVRVIWAHGAAGSGGLTNHGSRRGDILVNFATGETAAAAPDGMRLAHGIMMTIAWAVMVPLGVLSAVWVKPGTEPRCCGLLRPAVTADASVPQTWYVLHWRLQMGAALLSTIAFILALVFTGGAPPATPHAVLGIVVYVLMAVHVIGGLMRPGKPKAPASSASAPPAGPAVPPTPAIRTAWEVGHRIVGSLLPVLAVVAIVSGYLVFGSDVGIAVGVPVGLLAASLAGGVCTLRRCVPEQPSAKPYEPSEFDRKNPIGK